MAEQSPATKCQVKGFLSEVSPIKDTKAPYFDAVLQHEGESSKVVSFKPEDHVHFQNAESKRTQVTLEDVVLQPSKESSRKRNVFYTHSSKMSCVRVLEKAFEHTTSARPQVIHLSEILSLGTTSNKLNINVKINQEVCKKNCLVWDNRYLPKTEYVVADTTGSIDLTVWCEHNITVGDWYNITNVSVKKFWGKTFLSTTKNTQITNIPCQGTAVAAEVPTVTLKCHVTGANITSHFICPHRHELKDVTLSNPAVFCFSCSLLYKITVIVMKVSGHLNLKAETGNEVKAEIEDEVIRSVITVEAGASPQDIIQSFINLPPMQVTIRKNNIVKMEKVPQKTEAETEVKAEAETEVKAEAETEPTIIIEPVEESVDIFSPPDHGFFFSSQSRKRKSSDGI